MAAVGEIGLAQKSGLTRAGHETHRLEPVVGDEILGLGQRFARHGGDMGLGAVLANVEGQLVHRIGRRPFQRLARGGAPVKVGLRAGLNRHVADLVVGDHHLAAHRPYVQRCRIGLEPGHVLRQGFGFR